MARSNIELGKDLATELSERQPVESFGTKNWTLNLQLLNEWLNEHFPKHATRRKNIRKTVVEYLEGQRE